MKVLIGVFVFLFVTLLGGFFVFRDGDKVAVDTSRGSLSWVEVEKPKISLLTESGVVLHDLKTGDELAEGSIIATDKNGRATIHFADGSRVRLDSETRLRIENGFFQHSDRTLSVKLYLFAGRLWSRVVSLTTPASEWRVETGNAVAVVRGTTFGIEYDKDISRIVGSQDSVVVQLVDPSTRKLISEQTFVINEQKFLAVSDTQVRQLIEYEKAVFEGTTAPTFVVPRIVVQDVPSSFSSSGWIREQMLEDKNFKEEIRIREEKSGGERIRDGSAESSRSSVFPVPSGAKEIQKMDIPLSPQGDEFSQRVESGSVGGTGEGAVEQVPVKISGVVQPLELTLVPSRSFDVVVEGSSFALKAILKMADGSRNDVTGSVMWNVLGFIGSMEKGGIFMPRLDASISELGTAPGAITATYKDSVTGSLFFAQTPIFNVDAYVEEALYSLDG